MAEKKTVSAKDVIADIRVGMTDEQLMKKHLLSAKGLQSLKDKLLSAGLLSQAELDSKLVPPQGATSNRLSAKAILADIEAGVTNEGLIEKYALSNDRLLQILGKLVESGHLTQAEFAKRASGNKLVIRPTTGNLQGVPSPEQPSPEVEPQEKQATGESDLTRQKAEEIGQKAYGVAKEATGSAISAIKILVTDPMGGQGKALELLGEIQALSAGIVFVVAFVFSAVLLLKAIPFFPSSFEIHVKMAITALVPAVGLWAGFMAIGKLFKTNTSLNKCVFSTGVALVPTAFTFLALVVLGLGNLETVALVGFFGMSITLLLLNSAMLDVLNLSTQQAVLLTPTLILVSAYITKVIYGSLLFVRGW